MKITTTVSGIGSSERESAEARIAQALAKRQQDLQAPRVKEKLPKPSRGGR